MVHKGTIYLVGRRLLDHGGAGEGAGEAGGMLEVPAESLVALFTLQYCQNRCLRVVLMPGRVDDAKCKFPVSCDSLCFAVHVREEEEECPEVVCYCELPAMILQEEEEEEEEEEGTRKNKVKEGRKERKNGRERVEEEKEEEEVEEEEERVENEEEEEEEEEGKKEREEKEREKKRNDRQDLEETKKEEEEKGEENKEKINQKEKKAQKMVQAGGGGGGGESDCKVQSTIARREEDWCCAGLCCSLRLAVRQITSQTTYERNAHTHRNAGARHTANTNPKAARRNPSRPQSVNERVVSGSTNTNRAAGTGCNTTVVEKGNTNTNRARSDKVGTSVGSEITHEKGSTITTTTPHHAAALLGFRGGCLQACAEVSVWTKFCEVEVPLALLSLAAAPHSTAAEVEYPKELLRYERHLRRPPILHNALKRKQRHIRETVTSGAERDELIRRPLALLPELSHQYAEGPDMTLADLMLFPFFDLLLTNLTSSQVDPVAVTPLVSAWHGTVALERHIQMALPVLTAAKALYGTQRSDSVPRVIVPSVPDVSIYKSDPEREKVSRGAFTRQEDVEGVLRVVEGGGVEAVYVPWPLRSTSSTGSSSSSSSSSSFSSSSSSSSSTSTSSPSSSISSPSILAFTSSSSSSSSSSTSSYVFPSSSSSRAPLHTLLPALSLEGHIPQSRLQRKVQQVENICSAVLALANPGNVIVDFCSGGGHVGIPLAQCLPKCHVLLVENKVPSLERARDRVRSLGLRNVRFVQTNLDYFRGTFDIGVSLHACGAATDLVLGKCVAQGAAFVVVPCCYGSIRPNHIVSYPCSQAFRSLPLTLDQYLTLGHAADQTHGQDNPKTEQGQRCMRLVDGDRLAAVREVGYTTALALMHPPTCSPKNHLLMGRLAN